MSQIAKFVALVAAGVPLRQAQKITEVESLSPNEGVGLLIADAKRLGAPITLVGKRIVNFELELTRFQSEVAQAMAVPLQTRKLLLWLPALSLVIGQLSGFGTVLALFEPIGLVAMVLAGSLIVLGIKWSQKMLAPLRVPIQHPGFGLMRLGLAIRSGQPLGRVEMELLDGAIDLARLSKQTGAPLADLIDTEIELRATTHQQLVMTKAKELSIKLLIPMGLTVLPAFFILTIVPMFLGIGFN